MVLYKTPSFIRAAKQLIKKNPYISNDFKNTLEKLAEDPFDAQLKTHKLKGRLFGSYACSVNYEIRIIFQLIKDDDKREKIILLEGVGTHDNVY